MIRELSQQLGQVNGKIYGYLPKPMKKLVDEIAGQMTRFPIVDACYQTWWELQCQVENYYSEEKKRIRPPLSQQKEFRQIKNAVIKEAEHIRVNKFSFEDADMQDDGERISTYDMSYECQKPQNVANMLTSRCDRYYPAELRGLIIYILLDRRTIHRLRGGRSIQPSCEAYNILYLALVDRCSIS